MATSCARSRAERIGSASPSRARASAHNSCTRAIMARLCEGRMRVAASASVHRILCAATQIGNGGHTLPGVAERALVMLPSRLLQQLESGRRIRSRRFPHDRQLRVGLAVRTGLLSGQMSGSTAVAYAFGPLRSPHEHSSLHAGPFFGWRISFRRPDPDSRPGLCRRRSARRSLSRTHAGRAADGGPGPVQLSVQRRLAHRRRGVLCPAAPHAAGRGRGSGGVLLSVRVSACSGRSRCRRFGRAHSGHL